MPTREELLQRLKNKRRVLRDNTSAPQSVAQTMRKDPMTAMLAMGVDDPALLRNAKTIVKNPNAFLKEVVDESPPADEDADEEPPPLAS